MEFLSNLLDSDTRILRTENNPRGVTYQNFHEHIKFWNYILKKSELQGVKYFKFECEPIFVNNNLLNWSKEKKEKKGLEWLEEQYTTWLNPYDNLGGNIDEYLGLNVDLINLIYFSIEKYPKGHDLEGFYYLKGILGIQSLLPNDENLILLNLESMEYISKIPLKLTRKFNFSYLVNIKQIKDYFYDLHKDYFNIKNNNTQILKYSKYRYQLYPWCESYNCSEFLWIFNLAEEILLHSNYNILSLVKKGENDMVFSEYYSRESVHWGDYTLEGNNKIFSKYTIISLLRRIFLMLNLSVDSEFNLYQKVNSSYLYKNLSKNFLFFIKEKGPIIQQIKFFFTNRLGSYNLEPLFLAHYDEALDSLKKDVTLLPYVNNHYGVICFEDGIYLLKEDIFLNENDLSRKKSNTRVLKGLNVLNNIGWKPFIYFNQNYEIWYRNNNDLFIEDDLLELINESKQFLQIFFKIYKKLILLDPYMQKKLNILFDEDNYIEKFKKYLLKYDYEYYIFLIDITKKKGIDLTRVFNCLIFYFVSSKQLNFLFFLKNKLNKYDSYRSRSKKINIEEILIPEYNIYNRNFTSLKLIPSKGL